MPLKLPPNVRIAPGTIDDVPVILSFIKELADFEKLSHLVIATEATLAETLFGPKPQADVVVAFLNNEPVGFALYFHNFSTFMARHGLYLEDLYVRPHARRLGIGKALLLHVGTIAKERGCGRLEWAVLNWNENAIRLYKSLGAEPLDEWTVMRVSGKSLDEFSEK